MMFEEYDIQILSKSEKICIIKNTNIFFVEIKLRLRVSEEDLH